MLGGWFKLRASKLIELTSMTNSVPVARNYAIDWPTNTKKKHKKEIKLVILFFYGFLMKKKQNSPKIQMQKVIF